MSTHYNNRGEKRRKEKERKERIIVKKIYAKWNRIWRPCRARKKLKCCSRLSLQQSRRPTDGVPLRVLVSVCDRNFSYFLGRDFGRVTIAFGWKAKPRYALHSCSWNEHIFVKWGVYVVGHLLEELTASCRSRGLLVSCNSRCGVPVSKRVCALPSLISPLGRGCPTI